jgi:hypothetical protein
MIAGWLNDFVCGKCRQGENGGCFFRWLTGIAA